MKRETNKCSSMPCIESRTGITKEERIEDMIGIELMNIQKAKRCKMPIDVIFHYIGCIHKEFIEKVGKRTASDFLTRSVLLLSGITDIGRPVKEKVLIPLDEAVMLYQ
jgi:hypothetical protein